MGSNIAKKKKVSNKNEVLLGDGKNTLTHGEMQTLFALMRKSDYLGCSRFLKALSNNAYKDGYADGMVRGCVEELKAQMKDDTLILPIYKSVNYVLETDDGDIPLDLWDLARREQ